MSCGGSLKSEPTKVSTTIVPQATKAATEQPPRIPIRANAATTSRKKTKSAAATARLSLVCCERPPPSLKNAAVVPGTTCRVNRIFDRNLFPRGLFVVGQRTFKATYQSEEPL